MWGRKNPVEVIKGEFRRFLLQLRGEDYGIVRSQGWKWALKSGHLSGH